ncbi:MAG: DNA mismatch endonuclease Vsr [Planctomycetaceae bacterium]|nr:DNA mismatch endonuclease Vsr [Planctomycetaceae bacterium]
MADVFSPEKRSAIMARIKGGNTKPELLVRRIVHSLGYRYRLHSKQLPGKPDLVLPRHHKVIFVHGCFWHGHPRCKRSALPTSNVTFWQEKIGKNRVRDKRTVRNLRRMGWEVLVVWQCQTRDVDRLTHCLERFLQD